MEFNDLLGKHGIPPAEVLVMRHRPTEGPLRKILPWLAAEKPVLYNAYQQSQGLTAEKAMTRAKYVASFIGIDAGTALFAGLYAVKGSKEVDAKQWWAIAANRELHETYGMDGHEEGITCFWFDLVLDNEFYPTWRGRLVIRWPGGERSWWRWAAQNTFAVNAIREGNPFEQQMPGWQELVLSGGELRALPSTWQASLKEWRGIYYVWDSSDGRGYVGAAYGAENILGRWLDYGVSGDGGNKELRKRDPSKFQFSILERVSPDMPAEEVIAIENSWKARLHTRVIGLNKN